MIALPAPAPGWTWEPRLVRVEPPRSRLRQNRYGSHSWLESAALVATLLFGAGTLGAHAAEDPPAPPRPAGEAYDPSLAAVTSIEGAMAVLPSFIGRDQPTKAEVADGIDRFLRARFYHGFSSYGPRQNWIAALAGDWIWSHLKVPVLPEDVLDHPSAACSQQAMVFQELLKRHGIEYGAVTFSNLGPAPSNGHFAVAAKTEKGWLFHDSNQEPVNDRPVAVTDVLDGGAVTRIYPEKATLYTAAARRGDIRLEHVNDYPAPQAALFHRGTQVASSYGWAVFGVLYAGLKLASRRARRRTATPKLAPLPARI